MLQTKKAFTMIELIFVIVVIGILATVAIPRLAATRTDAVLVKGKSTVASIRSAISIEKGLRLMRGDSGYPEILDDSGFNGEDDELFDGNGTISILDNSILSGTKSGNWMKTSDTTYVFYVADGQTVIFTYNPSNGSFSCDKDVTYCTNLIK